MAVSKLWSVTSRLGQVIDYAANPEKTAADIYTEEQYQALRDVLSYAKDEEKTEREFFVEGINCNPATARDQFISVKKAYGKDDGIQAYHGYLSFKEQDISPELAQKIGMEFANEVWGKRFQVVVTTHLNTKHLHCHYVINSVSFVDGKRLWGDEKAWFKFRLVADCLCEKYGLYYNPNPNRSKQSSYYYKQEQAGMPSRYSMTREKAFAYKMKLDAMKRQAGRPSQKNSGQNDQNFGKVSRDVLAEEVGESSKQIQRYIRLTELIPELLDMVDAKKLNFTIAVDISYIDKEMQKWIYEYIRDTGFIKPKQITALRKQLEEGTVNQGFMISIFNSCIAVKAPERKVVLSGKKLTKYFPEDYSETDMEKVIEALLEQWKREQE